MESNILQYKMKDFIYYFLRQIEDKFNFYLQILEGAEMKPKSTSLPTNIVSMIALLLPKGGKAASSAIQKSESILTKKKDKDNAMKLADIIYYHSKKTDEVRDILIKSAYELFCCFEEQFNEISCNGGPTRALQKLGYDAGRRYINYLIENQPEEINSELVIESIITDTSNFLNQLGIIKSGHTVTKGNQNWKCDKIYTKVGIVINENYYKTKRTNTKIYGHRRKFHYEDLIGWELDESPEVSYNYLTSFDSYEDDLKNILEYLYSKDPEEFAKNDREIKHEATLNALQELKESADLDREVKHTEACQHRELLKDELAEEHNKIREEVTNILHKLDVIENASGSKELISSNDLMAIEKVIEEKLEKQDDAKVVIKLDKRGIEAELKKIDPTRTKEFNKIKNRISKIRF